MLSTPGLHEQHALVIHKDEFATVTQTPAKSLDPLIWQGNADIARAVTVFGSGIVVLPLIGKVSGVESKRCLAYASHPKRLSPQGLLDRADLASKYGQLEPGRLLEELVGGLEGLEERMRALSNEELQCEVSALLDWREKANGRLKNLEKRVAWAFLGILPDSCGQAAIKKAFKRRVLELHPDKGGDAERFQLLQDMKYLLIHKPVKQQSNQKQKHDTGQDSQKESAEDGDAHEAGFSSDSSYDASEEMKKMFPDKSKKKQKKEDQHEDDDELLVQEGSKHFNRARHEGMRRKLHRHLVDMWGQAGKLAEEIRRAQLDGGVRTMQSFRQFVDRFCATEIAHAEDKHVRKTADRIFSSFVEESAEILCAAGATDPVATMSCVAMQVNHPLLTMAPSPDLEQRCNALLEAIKGLPMTFQEHTERVQAFLLHSGSSPTKMWNDAVRTSQESFQITILLPATAPLNKAHPQKAELPGVNELDIVLPAGASLSDLRAAAQRVCDQAGFGNMPPRLFCDGLFIAGCSDTPVSQVTGLRAGCAVECLPSNCGLCLNITAQMPEQGSIPASTRDDKDSNGIATQLCQQSAQVMYDANPVQCIRSKGDTMTAAGDQWSPKTLLEREEINSEATCEKQGHNEDEDSDEWFDDFFERSHKVDDRITKEEVNAKEEEQQPSQKQSVQRGKDAMDARMTAQRKAVEARKKYDEAKKQAVDAKKTAKPDPERFKAARTSEAEAKPQDYSRTSWKSMPETSAMVEAGADELEQAIQKRRTKWDSNWSHMCAGEKRADGSAIYCHPCSQWVITGDPYDHHSFELHCEKIGHYGWID